MLITHHSVPFSMGRFVGHITHTYFRASFSFRILHAEMSALVPDTCYIMRSENGSCIVLQTMRACASGAQSVACLDRSGLKTQSKAPALAASATEASASDAAVPGAAAGARELPNDRDFLCPLDGPALFLEVPFHLQLIAIQFSHSTNQCTYLTHAYTHYH